jgi:ribosome-binding protein aMBF1 (putative translation factor)
VNYNRIHVNEDDKTPIDGQTPIEMVLDKLNKVGHDVKLAVSEAREAKGHALKTYDLQLELNEYQKTVDRRLTVIERTRFWLPLVAILMAALALLRTW